MEIHVNHKIIKDLCGSVSFKKGEAFFQEHKVKIHKYNAEVCEAIVSGIEDFHVRIEKETSGGFRSSCSCPSLTSFQKECQHVAAVLLAIQDKQHDRSHAQLSSKQELTESLLSLFKERPKRSSLHQLHFEKRKELETEFICSPVMINHGEYLLGIEIKIDSTMVQNIRSFLHSVKEGIFYSLSREVIYDPDQHCFQKETDAFIQKLIHFMEDEQRLMMDHLTKSEIPQQMIFLPPSSWKDSIDSLTKVPQASLKVNGKSTKGITIVNKRLPLKFDLTDSPISGFQLKISRLEQMTILHFYHSVLLEGNIYQLQKEDSIRLWELKQMLGQTGTDSIPISHNQLGLFIEKVVPGLKKLGEVQLSERITQQFLKQPLIAKLYLDRVKNRLLAGLEFHYEHIVFNPLEERKNPNGLLVIRDVEKEQQILDIMEESSFTKTEGGFFLHNEELEYEFLYHVIPKLEKLVQIYATTAVRNRIVKGTTKPMIRIKVKKERTDWLEFKFEMDNISEKQIRDVLIALEEKRKYFRLPSGSLLSLEAREFAEIKRFLNALPIQKDEYESTLNVPIISGFKLLNTIADDNMITMEESFKQFLNHLQNPGSLHFDVPQALESILREYQKHGYKWMKTLASYGFGGILGDTMGLGKTLQSITYILSELPQIRLKGKPVLVVCPSSLTYNWKNELLKFTPEIKTQVMDGNLTERDKKQKEAMDFDVMITSYPLVRRDIKWYEKQSFHTIFFDEAQAFKNPMTQTARAVKKLDAFYRFALTGTPVENSIEELWSIFHVVFPELFQELREFSFLSRKDIARRIRPFMLRRLKEDVLSELPEKMESVDSIELFPEQKRLYAAYLAKLRHETLKHLDKDTLRKNRIKILAGITRLRQICCHPALFVDGYLGSSGKFEQLMQVVDEAKFSGRRVLIFSQFTKMLELIGRGLSEKGISFFYLDGQTPAEKRVEICERFNEGEHDFFLISLKAGGTGLNLTGADTVVLYDIWWNPAVEEQAMDRAHRIGQTNTVQVIKLIARGTIEEKINELQDRKKQMIEEIIDPEEKVSLGLTEEEIREILMI
ncbi:SNF2 helicase associated domain-containing protein [Cytobacillus sp. Hz8]|uniref:DEAD/DEAH box helicase n=1 Tax=Cytobacillus sp. Hz8 TaxID=3347168 RepID=UPI0035E113B5